MPRFFFDLQRDGIIEPDRDGVHLPSLAAAKAEAARTAIDMVRDAVPADTPQIVVSIRDEHGKRVHEVEALVRVR
jgi:hypothetical protein